MKNKKLYCKPESFQMVFVLYLLLIFIQIALFNPAKEVLIIRVFPLLLIFAVYIFGSSLKFTLKDLKRILILFSLAGIASASLVIFIFFISGIPLNTALDPLKYGISSYGLFRVPAGLDDPNYFISNLLIFAFMPLCVLSDSKSSKRLKSLSLISFWMSTIAVIFTFSRAGYIVYLIGLYFVLKRLKYKRDIFIILFVCVIIVFIINLLGENLFYKFFLKRIVIIPIDTQFLSRISQNIGALKMFMTNPLLGVGIGNSPQLMRSFAPDILGFTFAGEMRIHSTLLEQLAEVGIFGFLLFASLYFITFRRLRNIARNHFNPFVREFASISLITFCLVALLSFTISFPHRLSLWIFFLIGNILRKDFKPIPQNEQVV